MVPSVKMTKGFETYGRNVESSCPEGADGFGAQPDEVPSDSARNWRGTLEDCRKT